jgi:pimeloyl-ACP methyl ester carboxylesterase
VRDTRNCIGALTLLNALGIAPDDEDDLVDVRTVAPSEIGKLSFTNPAFRPDFASDGIASVKYGRAYADSFPDGHFVAIPEAGHFPHLEQTGRTLGAIGEFVGTVVKPSIAD